MMTLQHCEEALSIAFVGAVAGKARHNVWLGKSFDYGVDGTFKQIGQRGNRRVETGFSLDFQAKATINWSIDNGNIIYDLEVRAYNDLAERTANDRAMPLILILLCLAPQESDWLEVTDENLILRRCGYWHKIDGPLTTNNATHRIRIPLTNRFTPECLTALLRKIENGEPL